MHHQTSNCFNFVLKTDKKISHTCMVLEVNCLLNTLQVPDVPYSKMLARVIDVYTHPSY